MRTHVEGCIELHQQSQANKINNKKQALFEEGLPCIHPRSNPASVLHFSSMLQDKQVTAPYGGVRKINNLEKFMCGAQMSNRRNINTGIPILNPSNKNPQQEGHKDTHISLLNWIENYFGISKTGTGNCLWT